MEKKVVRVLSKTQLALCYMPDAKPATARRNLRDWIKKNKQLQDELLETGYSKRAMLLTPRQVRIMFKHLGAP